MKVQTEVTDAVKAKSKARKLTDAIVRSYNRLDKDQIIPGDFPGLYLWVLKSGVKTWKYQQRIKGKKYPYRKTLGKYPTVGVNEALARAKQLSHKIYGGIDPREEIKLEALNIQMGVAIKKYYQELLTESNQYRSSTIKGVKAIFNPWIFRSTYDKNILGRLENVEDIQYKKLSMITSKMVRDLYKAAGSKSPIVANRLIEYLRLFWNDFVKGPDNPFIMDSKKKYEENEYLDYLDEQELQKVMATAVQVDQRSGRLLTSHYRSNRLNPVSCMAIAVLLTTGRRTGEVTSLKWSNYPMTGVKRLELEKTKTSKKNKLKTFKLGDDAVKILNHIAVDRLNNPESAFYYDIGDERNNFIFPSRDFGKLIGKGRKGTTHHILDCSKTWDKLLKMSGVVRPMKLYATRHTFATNFYAKTKDIKGGSAALGVTEKTFLKYAKLMSNAVVDGTNKIKFFKDEAPALTEVAKVAKVIE